MKSAIALGSNFGDSWVHLRRAAEALRRFSFHPHAVRASRVYQTEPVDCPLHSPPFLNAVILLDWEHSPHSLFTKLQELEIAAGRCRTVERHAPRPLDLDFLLYGELSYSSPDLVLPHPGMVARRFVLAPLADLIPDFMVPGTGASVAALLAALPETPRVEVSKELLFHKKT